MTTLVEKAVDTYVRAWKELDPARRWELVEACWAMNGRLVTRNREIRGRKALAEEMAKTHADPTMLGIRIVSAIDAKGRTFRFRAVADLNNGTSPETFDAGEIDDEGRISVILTFGGPLADANP